jgi:hypothetical protein
MLERMLPPEQYAAIYSNAHNGNSVRTTPFLEYGGRKRN